MLNLDDGRPLAMVTSGPNLGEVIFLEDHHDDHPDDSSEDEFERGGYDKINLKKDVLIPLLNTDQRECPYIAGPSGSGKSTYASSLATCYKKIFPKRDIYIFSRTDVKDDPAYKKLNPLQIKVDQDLIDNPIDIEKDIKPGSLVIFDDTTSIRDENIKKEINKLIVDILEVGRKLGIWIIITSHLVNGTDRKLSRVIMNEMTSFTFFPKSGSSYQIDYCLKQYMGLSKKQIEQIFDLKSRWVTVYKNYPMVVLHQHGAYLL